MITLLSFCFLMSTSSQAVDSIRVSQLNVWQEPRITPDQRIRSKTIGQRLVQQGADIALLQEAFTKKNRVVIQNNSNLGVGSYFNEKSLFTSGLYTISHYPIISRDFFKFTLRGKFWEIDPLAAKGVGVVNLDIKGQTVAVYNTHLMARWGRDNQQYDKNTPDRMNQLFEIFAFIVEKSPTDKFLIGGDFNMRWLQSEFGVWSDLTGMKGVTVEGPNTPFCTSCAPNAYKSKSHNAGQLDYLFVSPRLKVESWKRDFDVKFEKKTGGDLINHSNHYGLVTNVAFTSDPKHGAAHQRERTQSALVEVLAQLNVKYKNPGPLGNKKRIKAVRRLVNYLDALSAQGTPRDPEVARIKTRLDWYFSLFN